MGQERRSAAKEAWSGVETEGGNGSRESGVGSREPGAAEAVDCQEMDESSKSKGKGASARANAQDQTRRVQRRMRYSVSTRSISRCFTSQALGCGTDTVCPHTAAGPRRTCVCRWL